MKKNSSQPILSYRLHFFRDITSHEKNRTLCIRVYRKFARQLFTIIHGGFTAKSLKISRWPIYLKKKKKKKRERRGNRGRHLATWPAILLLPRINKNENVKSLRYGAVSGTHERYSIYLGWRAVYFALWSSQQSC